eukprot:scaffold783_cov313-Chaetoceros_neogracile.AAC.3
MNVTATPHNIKTRNKLKSNSNSNPCSKNQSSWFIGSLFIGPIILSCVLKYPNGHEKQNSRYNESFSQSMELTNLVVLDLDNIVNDFDLYNTMDNDYSLRTMLPVFIFTISSLGKQRMTGPQ